MTCGTKIDGRFGSYFEREELRDKLEREGEFRLADKVRRGECLSWSERNRAEMALDRQGMSRHFDYAERSCACNSNDEPL